MSRLTTTWCGFVMLIVCSRNIEIIGIIIHNGIGLSEKCGGWGWVPVTWQGFAVTGIYLGLVTLLLLTKEETVAGDPNSGSNFLVLGLPILVLTITFVFILYNKGEKPKWQWGLPEKDET